MVDLPKLASWGANVQEGLSRCVNNEAFYLRLVQKGLGGEDLDALEEALKEHDLDRAFGLAHKLKGVYANLALTPMLTPIAELTELLRNKIPGDYMGLLNQAKSKRTELLD